VVTIVPAAALIIATVLMAPVALAADIEFGEPRAETVYGEAIDFSVDLAASVPVERVELRLLFPGAIGPHRVAVPVPSAGGDTLRYRLDLTGGGGLVPNTSFTATWVAFPADGSPPVTSAPQTVRYRDTSHEWRTVGGDLVTVHWHEGSRAFAERALRIAEQAVRETADHLGVAIDEPFDFFIYGDEGSFRRALGPGAREWVAGTSHDEIRTLFALIAPGQIDDAWVEIVVPHEVVHLVFSTITENPFRGPPLWLHEGLATYLSEGYTADNRATVERAARNGDLIPLAALTSALPTDPERAGLAYAETASAVDHLVRTKGDRALVDLVSSYAEGLTDDEAFTRAVGTDLAGFQQGWLAELGAQAPQRYGPQPAPPGPLPPGWEGPVPTPGSSPGAAASTVPSPSGGTGGGTGGAPAVSPVPSAAPGVGGDGGAGGLGGLVPLALVAGVVVVIIAGLALVRRRGAG
jgi:hypothetical protein